MTSKAQTLESASMALSHRIAEYKREHPQARLVDIAAALGVSERDAVASQIPEGKAHALRPDWQELLPRLASLGPVMALTRNRYVVSECRGQYGVPQISGFMGLVHEGNIDLRIFLSQWHSAFSLRVDSPKGILSSLQFFDAEGRALHKVYLEDETYLSAYEQVIADFRMDPGALLPVVAKSAPTSEYRRALSSLEVDTFRNDWQGLQDTHEFHGLLRRHKLHRLQAMEIAGESLVREVHPQALSFILERASSENLELMAFVGNPGIIQIYSGTVKRLKRLGDWFNVLDPTFNLHADEKGLTRAFFVKKPTRYGVVSSLEFFSPEHELVLSLFGLRKDEGQPSPEWLALLESVDAI